MQLNRKAVKKVCEYLDGHTIFDPDHLIKDGLPQEFVENYTRTFKSNGTGKGNIYKDGKVLDELKGVYGLHILQAIADIVGADYETKSGRGFQAESYRKGILKRIDEVEQ
tara:strand:+ start:494 stop:823 length:330 start_codon:yes stop_codon:yes gene_type:complete